MPRHKRNHSLHSSKKSKRRHRERSWTRSPRRRSRSRSNLFNLSERLRSRATLSRRPSRESSGSCASFRERLLGSTALHEVLDYMRRHEAPALGEVPAQPERPASLLQFVDMTTSLEEPGEVSVPSPVPDDAQSADLSQDGDPTTSMLPGSDVRGGVTFSTPVVSAQFAESRPKEPPASTFAQELFGELAQVPAVTSWLPIILDTIRSEIRSGLQNDLRSQLLTKYEPKNALAFLGPPRVNKEILPNLSATVVARDKHQMTSQAQVGASLNAFGSGISELSQLDCLQTSTEGKAAVTKIADGIRLLADHYFRLSQTRRAFIVPSLNFLGKSVSDLAPIDEYLFGSNFAEDVNAAQSIERVARKMARQMAPQPSASQSRPLTQQSKQRFNPQRELPKKQENSRPPLHRSSSIRSSKRDAHQQNRNRRTSSRSRVGPRH